MLISCCLLFFGGKLVLRSDDNTEVIMNCMAAYFVAETDKYVYRYLCPSSIQKALGDPERFPPLRKRIATVDLTPAQIKRQNEARERKLKQVAQNIDQFDINHDSELDESELAAMFKSLAVTLSPLEIRHIVAFCDKDCSGMHNVSRVPYSHSRVGCGKSLVTPVVGRL
jgi:hypothetical protein